WKNLLDGLAELDRLSIDSSTPIGEEGDRQIFSIAMQTIAATVHQANLLDVRLLNKEGTELHLFETLGDAWPSDTKPLTKARKSSSDTADLNVQLEKTSVLTADSLEEGYRELFPEITSMLRVPLFLNEKPCGLVDVCTNSPASFSEDAIRLVEMV